MVINPLSLRSDFTYTGMNLLVQMAQAVAFQDITATLLMCTYKQNFKLITNAQEKIFNKNRGAKVSK